MRRSEIYDTGVRPIAPTEIAGLLFWLGDSMVLNGASTKVASWDDLSGNGNHFVQATDARQPLYTASDANFNGKKSVRFSGGQVLDSVNVLGTWDNVAIFIVERPVAVSSGLQWESDASAGAGDLQIQYGAGDLINNYMWSLDQVAETAASVTLTKYHRGYLQPWGTCTTVNPSIYRNGALSPVTVVSNTLTNRKIDSRNWHLGARVSGAAGYNGHVASAFAYAGDGAAGIPTAAQIAGLYAWTTLHYGQ